MDWPELGLGGLCAPIGAHPVKVCPALEVMAGEKAVDLLHYLGVAVSARERGPVHLNQLAHVPHLHVILEVLGGLVRERITDLPVELLRVGGGLLYR